MITADIQGLTPGAEISLFEVDGNDVGAGTLRFHGYARVGSIWWQGQEFFPWPIEAQGFARTSDRPPTPTLKVGNIDGTISALCMATQDMVGAKVIRHRTLVKYLDAENFFGDDVITNGAFYEDLFGWSIVAGTVTWSDGKAIVGNAATATDMRQAFPTVAGKVYQIRFECADFIVSTQIGTTNGGSQILPNLNATLGVNTRTFVGNGATMYLRIQRGASASFSKLDNVTIRENIGNPDANPDEHFPPEIWFIERKANEEADQIMFELVGYDLNGVKIPRRQIIPNHCTWIAIGGYRGPYCGYTGGPVAKLDDTPTSDPLLDDCSGRLAACKMRFGEDAELPYGGFPAAGLMRG